MTEHRLFYYPYASFTNPQLPLVRVAALYFDKLVILDPVGASRDSIGADLETRDTVRQLRDARILEMVTPSSVLERYEKQLAEGIAHDMRDSEFLELCAAESRTSGKQGWTLSLAKVPRAVQTDQAMRHLMGDFARRLASEAGQFEERAGRTPVEYREYAERGRPYDEFREGYSGDIQYRVAHFPLALGEAIMMNHALFGGLLLVGATPITDDAFHSKALALKLRRAANEAGIRQIQSDRARSRQLKADALAAAALTDQQLNLPVLNPEIPLQEVLEYRRTHGAALEAARDKLGWMARRIESEPWSEDFARELEHRTIPDIANELEEARRARDAWLTDRRGRLALSATGIAVGAAAAVLSVFAAPLTPVALATAGLSLVSGTAIPGVEWLLDWRDGRKSVQENGLHYLLTM